MKTSKPWDHTHVYLDNTFCFYVSQHLDNDCDPTNVTKACNLSDWPMGEKTMEFELKSLRSWKVFSLVKTTQRVVNECLWRNEISIELQQENGRTMRLCPLLWKTTIVALHFAHANPWLLTIPNLSWILCTFFSNAGQGLKLLIYHLKILK